MKKTPIHALTISVVIIVFAWLMIERAQADDLFGGESFFNSEPSKSDTNFLWEGDGSLTVVTGAKESGYVIKDGEVETYVVPSDTGNTFINNGTTGELIICNSAMGCY
tara:strand:+ start:62 stop:385 length:324 start_codon:yes stop_codon:yes gene_type:complete